WAGILRELGHHVVVAIEWVSGADGECDLLIALHARRSYPSVERFHRTQSRFPLIVAMTGTDLYGDLTAGNPEAHRSIELATRIVVLQEAGPESLPGPMRPKDSVIYQSAVAPASPRPPRQDCLEVCVLSHLRDVKDPLLAANAARLLPDESRVRIVHAGRALNSDWEAAAREQERKNPRYEWVGDQPHDQAMYLLSGSRYLVLSSDYRDPLHFHRQAGNRQAAYGDQRAGRKTLFKNFLADGDEPVPVPRIGDKHGHRHHVLQGPPLCLQRLLDRRKHIPHLCIKVRHRWQRRGLSSKPKNLSAFCCHGPRERALLRPRIGRITLLGINGRRPQGNHKPRSNSYETTDLPCRHAILLLNSFMRL